MLLITGGLGFIGSHFASQACKDHPLVIVDNLSNSSINVYYDLLKHSKKNHIFFYKADILDYSKLQDIIKSHKVQSVIHFAGLKAVGQSVNFPGKYFYNNVLGSKVLFNLVKKYKIQNLIFSSSATVYGNPIKLPLDENHPVRATNPYGQNKIDIENLLFNNSYFNDCCSVKILRYFNPIGANPEGWLGENPRGIPNNLMPLILKVAIKKIKELQVFGNDYPTPDGTGIRDYIHIMDLVNGHIKALSFQEKGISTFNLGTGQGYSVLELINTFEKVTNISIPYKIVPRRRGDVAKVFANCSRAEHILNFKAEYNIWQMCSDAWNYTKQNH